MPEEIEIAAKDLTDILGFQVTNYAHYHDGFSFTVGQEIEAYKSAYVYRFCKNVIVKKAAIDGLWLVQVYTQVLPESK